MESKFALSALKLRLQLFKLSCSFDVEPPQTFIEALKLVDMYMKIDETEEIKLLAGAAQPMTKEKEWATVLLPQRPF